MNEGGAAQNKSFVKIGSDFGKIMPGKRGKGMKRSILSRMAAFLLIFVLGFAVVAGNNVSTVEAAARSSSINMNIFKKKNVRTYLQDMSYAGGINFSGQTQLKKNLPKIVCRDFLYANWKKYKRYRTGVDMLVPKSVVLKHIQDTYGIKVKSVNLPVKKGKYLLKELWWQSETVMKYYNAVRTKTGATITIRGSLFGRYEGKEVITVKPARNSMGFVITSMRYYRAGR